MLGRRLRQTFFGTKNAALFNENCVPQYAAGDRFHWLWNFFYTSHEYFYDFPFYAKPAMVNFWSDFHEIAIWEIVVYELFVLEETLLFSIILYVFCVYNMGLHQHFTCEQISMILLLLESECHSGSLFRFKEHILPVMVTNSGINFNDNTMISRPRCRLMMERTTLTSVLIIFFI